MELILALIILIALFTALDLAAAKWGVNSRSYGSDWQNRSDYDVLSEN